MNIADIIALAGAGFTKDDIVRIAGSMNTSTPIVTPTPTPTPTPITTPTPTATTIPTSAPVMYQPTPTPAQTQTPTPTPAPTPASSPVPNTVQPYMPTPQPNGVDFGNKLDQILGAVQSSNIMSMQVQSQPTTEDMLAEIINPRGVE